ncbi:carbonic anhydrase 4 isoform X2 [Mastomys coucha]|uniref:carbonic anhydrase 4 isoform X2 n=1 Tax=Mastomys coucha TaxID=35658 RepID=UPI00126187F2|nr:carbonic anhydrase 4 isoform X2 [Mastomys coucha]
MQLLLALLVLAYVAPSTEDSAWCYEIQTKDPNSHCLGPKEWPGDCKGGEQSPINIVISKAKVNPRLTPIVFVGYDQKKQWLIRNNQHSVEMSLGGGISITGGDLPAQYEATQLHLHWSEEKNKGSEHSIDGKHFAMEMHIVHKKVTSSSSSNKEQDSRDKIAVLAFMVEIGEKKNEGFQPLVETLSSISKPNATTTVRESSLQDLLPPSEKLHSYFRYQGSLTTPNCDETVIWTFLEFSKKLYYDKDQKLNMKDNVRPLQPLGKRLVLRSHATRQLLSLPLPTLLVPTLACLVASFLQ